MPRGSMFALAVLGAVALGTASGTGPSSTGPPAGDPGTILPGCADPAARPVVLPASAASSGGGIWVAVGGDLTRLGPGGDLAVADARAAVGTSVRHIANVPGVGTAFIEDGAGTDTVVLETEAGSVRIPQRAEAVNPSLSARGDLAWSVGTQIRIRRARSGAIRRLPVPVQGGLAFSPVFVPDGDLVVAVAHPATRAVPEDERLDDLWRVTPRGRWRRLTSFVADDDRWAAVRTPVPAPGGGVDFVLVRGRGSATREPRFALMHLEAGRLTRLRLLDREMYLAGFDGHARLWNVPDLPAARVDLVRESHGGELTTIGCGAVLMDPIDVVDPDRAAGAGGPAPPRAPSPPQTAPPATATGEIGILVGDFVTPEAAETVAAEVRATVSGGERARLVDATTSPHAVRPGAYGVLLPLAPEADPQAALAAFRASLPAYASSSWVVPA
jgi:hypothetical protein